MTHGAFNGGMTVILDNIANIVSMTTILIGVFGLPQDFVFDNMVPGTALGIFFGNAFICYLTFRIARTATVPLSAIPLGLDAPTTINLPLLVVGPTYVRMISEGMSPSDAADFAWKVGCATVVIIAIIKFILMGISGFLQNSFHEAGKIGALVGVAFALLGLNQTFSILSEPVAGLCALSSFLMFAYLFHDEEKTSGIFKHIARHRVLSSAVLGLAIFYPMAAANGSRLPLPKDPTADWTTTYPHPVNIYSSVSHGYNCSTNMINGAATLMAAAADSVSEVYGTCTVNPGNPFVYSIQNFIGVSIPFAMLVHIGGLTITTQAIDNKHEYNLRSILAVDAASTLLAAMFGGISQTTPWIGHPTFVQMKTGKVYGIIAGGFVAVGACVGFLRFLFNILIPPVIVPIFVGIGIDMMRVAFHGTGEKPHQSDARAYSQFTSRLVQMYDMAPATVLAMFPSVAQLINITGGFGSRSDCDPCAGKECGVIVTFSHGFITTALLWGSAFGYALDQQFWKSAGTFVVAALFAGLGVIHSVDPTGAVYWPWDAPCKDVYQWMAAYLALAVLMMLFWVASQLNARSQGEGQLQGSSSYHHLERPDGIQASGPSMSLSNRAGPPLFEDSDDY